MEWTRDTFTVSDDPARLDLDAVHAYLTRSYWVPGVSRAVVERAARNSMTFGLYAGEAQIGYARVITDRTTFAYFCDVYVLEEHRGQGLGVWLMKCVLEHPDLVGLRRYLLATRNAHGLYRKFGFSELEQSKTFMHILDQAGFDAKG